MMKGMNLLSLLVQEPLVFLVIVAALVFTLSVHEFSHAWVARLLGDRTAEREGRLTLNPLAHLDPFGFLLILLAGFGYAKPVPYNPYNLKYPVWGPAMIAAAGPGSNLFFGFLFAFLYGFAAPFLGPNNLLVAALWFLGRINFALMLFNLIPLPPLDGSKALLSALSGPQYQSARYWLETQGPILLLGLIILDAALGLQFFSWISTVSDVLFRLVS
jgi:Zn-dependent protease